MSKYSEMVGNEIVGLSGNKLEVLPDKSIFIQEITSKIGEVFPIVEINDQKPWGGYIRFDNNVAGGFIKEFFPGVSMKEVALDIENIELSPKILIVSPKQRLSWQYHNRRAECWSFLTAGGYHKSEDDNQGEPIYVEPGHFIQFNVGERHRLIGQHTNDYAVVAEIWQHVDPDNTSDEDDIIRIDDDYKR